MLRFLNKKGEKSPDYEHCRWGRGEVFAWDLSFSNQPEITELWKLGQKFADNTSYIK